MILTLTPNPSVDETIALSEHLERGAVHRVATTTSQSGGKGVNISRASVAAGEPSVAVLPADADDPFVLELAASGIALRAVPTGGAVRVNVTIAEPDGTTTKLNSPGTEISAAVLERLTAELEDLAAEADWTVLAGSLPPGAPVDWYAALAARLRSRGTRVAVDTSDAPSRPSSPRSPARRPT
ncbi:1-phosphofructokinase family hexose kinase [Nocardioides zeae]